MFNPAAEPRWMRRCTALALRLGFLPSLAALSALLVAGVLGLTQAAVLLLDQGPKPQALLVAGAISVVLAPFLAAWLLQLMFQLSAARQRQVVHSTLDELTGAYNRRHFLQLAEREWARCRRYAEDGAMLVIDADQFKAHRGSLGGGCCDTLLRDMVRLVAQSLRQPDLLARYGAATLIVFLPNTDPLGALDVAERIRERVSRLTLEWRGESVRASASVGVVTLGAQHESLGALVGDADLALYAAKDAGRNCVRTAEAARGGALRSEDAGSFSGYVGGPHGPWGTRAR